MKILVVYYSAWRMDRLAGNNLSLIEIPRRYTLAVVVSSAATRIRRHLLSVYDHRRSTVSGRAKKGRWLCAFHVIREQGSGGGFQAFADGRDAYIAEKEAELAPKIDAIVAEARARQKDKEKQNE